MDALREKELVCCLIQGDEDAFCELYAAYKEKLIYFAMRFLQSRDYAEDLFQDVFTVIWQGRQSLNPETSFSSYLYTIMKNRLLNRLRDLETHNRLCEHILRQMEESSDETRQEIVARDLGRLIDQALTKLTPRQREIFEMSRYRQLSHKEIAHELGISVYTVQEAVSASLQTLRKYMKE